MKESISIIHANLKSQFNGRRYEEKEREWEQKQEQKQLLGATKKIIHRYIYIFITNVVIV